MPFIENLKQVNGCLPEPRVVLFTHMDHDRFVYFLREFELLLEYFVVLCSFIGFFDALVVKPNFTDGDDLIYHVILSGAKNL